MANTALALLRLLLPARRMPRDDFEGANLDKVVDEGKEVVLIAVSSLSVRAALLSLVEQLGHSSRAAASPAQAIAVAKALRPAVVLVDEAMCLTRADLTAQLKEIGGPALRLVLLGGPFSHQLRMRDFSLRLTSPLTVGDLAQALDGIR